MHTSDKGDIHLRELPFTSLPQIKVALAVVFRYEEDRRNQTASGDVR